MSKVTLNIDTDLDEQIKKCEELIKKYEELGGHAKQLHFVTVKELAEMKHCSIKTAQDLFNLHDFPSEDFRKGKSCIARGIKKLVYDKKK